MLDFFFCMKLFTIKFSLGIFVFYLEYFNNIANNTREVNIYVKNVFLVNKILKIIYFCFDFGFYSIFFYIAISTSIGHKIVNKKNKCKQKHNYFQHHKDKSQNDTLTRQIAHNSDIFVTYLCNTLYIAKQINIFHMQTM